MVALPREMEIFQDHLLPMHAFVDKLVDEENFKAIVANNNPNLQVFIKEGLEVEADPH